jgi:hypothetical protein
MISRPAAKREPRFSCDQSPIPTGLKQEQGDRTMIRGCATPLAVGLSPLTVACASNPLIGVTRVDPRTIQRSLSTSVVANGEPSDETRTVLEEEGLIGRFEDDPAATIGELPTAIVSGRRGTRACSRWPSSRSSTATIPATGATTWPRPCTTGPTSSRKVPRPSRASSTGACAAPPISITALPRRSSPRTGRVQERVYRWYGFHTGHPLQSLGAGDPGGNR